MDGYYFNLIFKLHQTIVEDNYGKVIVSMIRYAVIIVIAKHPLYSPDLAPNDNRRLPQLKEHLEKYFDVLML